MSYVEGVNLQNYPIGGHLKIFRSGHEKMLKTEVFHKTLISRNLLKEAQTQAHCG